MLTTAQTVQFALATLSNLAKVPNANRHSTKLIHEVVTLIEPKGYDVTFVDTNEISYCFDDNSFLTLYHNGDNAKELAEQAAFLAKA